MCKKIIREYYSKNIILLLYLYEICFCYLLDNDNINLNDSLVHVLIVGTFWSACEWKRRVAGNCGNGLRREPERSKKSY